MSKCCKVESMHIVGVDELSCATVHREQMVADSTTLPACQTICISCVYCGDPVAKPNYIPPDLVMNDGMALDEVNASTPTPS